jgi:hypothetical protein
LWRSRRTDRSSPTLAVSVSEEADGGFRYVGERTGAGLVIRPRDPYLDALRGGGPIESMVFRYSPWARDFRWPTIDVTVVNTSGRTVRLDEVVFRVARSRIDPRPVPVLAGPGNSLAYPLSNLGWGPMTDGVLSFGLAADGIQGPVPETHEWTFADPRGSGAADVGPAAFLAGAGVDLVPLGRDANGAIPAHLTGTLAFTQARPDGRPERRSHRVRMALGPEGRPAGVPPPPPARTAHVRLRVDGDDYTVRATVGQHVAAGDTDHFRYTLAADRSSVHDLTVSLTHDGTTATAAEPVTVEVFVSTFDAGLHVTPTIGELRGALTDGSTGETPVDRPTARRLLEQRAGDARARSRDAARLAAEGDTGRALLSSRSAVDDLRDIVAADPRERPSLGRALRLHADLLVTAGERAKAEFALREAKALYEQLATTGAGYARLLAEVKAGLARAGARR